MWPDYEHSFTMETKLNFGKYKGTTVKELFDLDKDSYLLWIYENFNATFSKEIEEELEWRLAENDDIARSFIWGLE